MAAPSRHQGGGSEEQRLRASVRPVVIHASAEAGRRGAAAIEAEHLLLAVAFDRGNPASRLLAEHGLDYAGIERALVAEREHAVRAAGIEPVAAERLVATPRGLGPAQRRLRLGWGASAKEALVRGHRMAPPQARHGMRHSDLALGVLAAELGTVPRALALAGVDRTALLRELAAL